MHPLLLLGKELHRKSFQLILLETLLSDNNQIVSHLRAQQPYTQSFIIKQYKEMSYVIKTF